MHVRLFEMKLCAILTATSAKLPEPLPNTIRLIDFGHLSGRRPPMPPGLLAKASVFLTHYKKEHALVLALPR